MPNYFYFISFLLSHDTTLNSVPLLFIAYKILLFSQGYK